MADLPLLSSQQLNPTRDYLRDVALAMGSLQRGFLQPHPKDWQHGLEITMRGISTQAFVVNGEESRVVLDLGKSRVRIGNINWSLAEYNGAEIFNNFKIWLQAKNALVNLEEPEFSGGIFDTSQSKAYSEALWWVHKQFQIIKAEISMGGTSPIFLYPHHFDLSLVYYPWNDDKQISIGFSAGDETIPEPYIYLTLYPESKDLADMLKDRIPTEAYWQKEGFSGGILIYENLRAAEHPDDLLRSFVGQTTSYAVSNGF